MASSMTAPAGIDWRFPDAAVHRSRSASAPTVGAVGGARTRLPVRITRALAAVVSTLVVAGSGYGWVAYRTLGDGVTTIAGIPDRTTAPGRTQNILLVGDDHRPADADAAELAQLSTGEDGGSDNTDTMMVLHLPADGSAATVVSLPRDSWVDVPGIGKGKLNSAFADGAADGGGDAAG